MREDDPAAHLMFVFYVLLSYRLSKISYSLQRLTAFQTQNLYIGPQAESHKNKIPDQNPLFPGAEAKPDPIKGGLRVTSFFTYNCLAVSLSTYLQPFRNIHSQEAWPVSSMFTTRLILNML